jgi:hypothetical protein
MVKRTGDTPPSWASVRRLLAVAPRLPKVIRSHSSWATVRPLIDLAHDIALPENDALRLVLIQSSAALQPLHDPLLTDFGLHRWLGGQREEAYSDWFAWILEQLTTQDVVSLLRMENYDVVSGATLRSPVSEREVWVLEGTVGRTGRVDILLRLSRTVLLLLELKLGPPSAEEKQQGYLQSSGAFRPGILIARAMDSEAEEAGFIVRSWAGICSRLRQIAARIVLEKEKQVLAALVLAFAGAVEQNILDFNAASLRSINKRQRTLMPREKVESIRKHLQGWLQTVEKEVSK